VRRARDKVTNGVVLGATLPRLVQTTILNSHWLSPSRSNHTAAVVAAAASGGDASTSVAAVPRGVAQPPVEVTGAAARTDPEGVRAAPEQE